MVIFQFAMLNYQRVINHWIGLVGKNYTGKPHMNNGKITLVSGFDFPSNQSIELKVVKPCQPI